MIASIFFMVRRIGQRPLSNARANCGREFLELLEATFRGFSWRAQNRSAARSFARRKVRRTNSQRQGFLGKRTVRPSPRRRSRERGGSRRGGEVHAVAAHRAADEPADSGRGGHDNCGATMTALGFESTPATRVGGFVSAFTRLNATLEPQFSRKAAPRRLRKSAGSHNVGGTPKHST